MTTTKEAPSVHLVVCSDCNREQPLVSKGLCEDCYRRKYPTRHRLIECTDCGRTKPHTAFGLCKACYVRRQRVECARCGEIKRPAAHGLCVRCYNHIYRDPKTAVRMAVREAARAEQEKALAQQLAEEAAEWQQRRCETCQRLLCLTRDTMHWRTRVCDKFCWNHHPERRAARGSAGRWPKVKAILDARKAEADRQVEGMR